MAACLALTVPLEIAGARVLRAPRRLVRAMAVPIGLFVVWDVVAIARDTWWFSPVYTTGWRLAGRIPVEELLFFVVIPVCSLLTFETVRRILRRA